MQLASRDMDLADGVLAERFFCSSPLYLHPSRYLIIKLFTD